MTRREQCANTPPADRAMPESKLRLESEPAPPPLRVLLVDDHEIVRRGIRATLAEVDDIVVTAEASTVREAIQRAERELPDVVVMDVRLGDGSGIEATREIRARRPATKVLMLTSFADDDALFASIMAGAAGYILKQIHDLDLIQAIRTVGQGHSLLDPVVTERLLERLRTGADPAKDDKLALLSPQEERILAMMADGLTNRQIGEKLHLAEKTIKNYVSSILAKLEVGRRAEAAAYLARHTRTPGA
jgi:two-component system response regulator DevR